MVDASVAREIEEAVGAALARSGVAGRVVVRDSYAELHGVGQVVAIDLGEWVEQWNLIPEDMRNRRADKAALRLRNAVREAQGRSPLAPATPGRRSLGAKLVAPLIAVTLVLVVVGYLWQTNFFGEDASPSLPVLNDEPPPAPTATGETKAQRDARACEAGRRQLYAGASLNLDVAGWVVELWLARDAEELDREKVLRDAAANGPREVDVREKAGTAAVLATKTPWVGAAGAVLRFRDGYVGRFFSSKGRSEFIAFAQRAVRETKASHAALYARCAHLDARDVGAWYYGQDRAAAMATLWLAAGAYAEQPAVSLAKLEEGHALARLREAAREGMGDLETQLRDNGVRMTEESGGVALRFPLGGPTRAAKISRILGQGLDGRLK